MATIQERSLQSILEPVNQSPKDASAPERQAQLLLVFWDSRFLILRSAGVGLLIATLVAFLIPKSYTAITRLMPPNTGASSGSGMALLAAMASKVGDSVAPLAGDLLGAKTSGALFIGVLRSETAQNVLIQKFDLRKEYSVRLQMEARRRLDENTSISEDKKSGIITISVTDHSPQRAATLANSYVDELNSLISGLSTSSARRERIFLENRLKVVKSDLDEASNQLAQYSSKNNTMDIQQQGKAVLDAAGTLTGEMIAAQSELEGLRQIYTDSNPRVRALNARVTELRSQLAKIAGTSTANGVLSSNGESDSSGNKADGLPFPTIRNLPLLGVKYADYYRSAKIQETVYELLTEQYEMAKVQEAKEIPSVKVLDPAEIPEGKSFPPRLAIIFFGALLAFVISLVWVFAISRWHEIDLQDPRRIALQHIADTLHAHMPGISKRRHIPVSIGRRIWKNIVNRPHADD